MTECGYKYCADNKDGKCKSLISGNCRKQNIYIQVRKEERNKTIDEIMKTMRAIENNPSVKQCEDYVTESGWGRRYIDFAQLNRVLESMKEVEE